MILKQCDRIVLAPERRYMTGYSDMHVWRLEKVGKFPRRIQLGPNRVGWSFHELQQGLDDKKANRRTAHEEETS